jgi:hypothetical protein
MPEQYLKEMIADWIGAGIAITGTRDFKSWYLKNKHNINLSVETKTSLEQTLEKIK